MNGKIKIIEQKSNFKKKISIFLNGLIKEKYFIRDKLFYKLCFFLDMSLEFRMLDSTTSQRDFNINYIKYLPFIDSQGYSSLTNSSHDISGHNGIKKYTSTDRKEPLEKIIDVDERLDFQPKQMDYKANYNSNKSNNKRSIVNNLNKFKSLTRNKQNFNSKSPQRVKQTSSPKRKKKRKKSDNAKQGDFLKNKGSFKGKL